MPYKTFESPTGTRWQVWRVVPSDAERRHGDRRQATAAMAAMYRGPERRVNPDRRVADIMRRTVVGAGFEQGWLCFENEDGEKRRLAPVPAGWEEASDDKLWLWCRAGKSVLRCGPLA